ncbi:MAG: metallophosphoesterase [Clostridia bacterium]|nr:metallophosphoesterase [Clostridia bacterium]
MRILVISDTHKNPFVLAKIIRSQPEARHVFFLGDVVSDIENIMDDFKDKSFHIVKGNCDGFCSYQNYDIVKLENKNILFTHGDKFSVKYGTARISEFARNSGCHIALYGHTHIPNISYEDGIYLVNPGSAARPRESRASYAVIDIVSGGIKPIIIYL